MNTILFCTHRCSSSIISSIQSFKVHTNTEEHEYTFCTSTKESCVYEAAQLEPFLQTANSWTFKEKVKEKHIRTHMHATWLLLADCAMHALVFLFFIIIEYEIIPYFVPRLNSMGEHACSFSLPLTIINIKFYYVFFYSFLRSFVRLLASVNSIS